MPPNSIHSPLSAFRQEDAGRILKDRSKGPRGTLLYSEGTALLLQDVIVYLHDSF